jgi:hypothetical protein
LAAIGDEAKTSPSPTGTSSIGEPNAAVDADAGSKKPVGILIVRIKQVIDPAEERQKIARQLRNFANVACGDPPKTPLTPETLNNFADCHRKHADDRHREQRRPVAHFCVIHSRSVE